MNTLKGVFNTQKPIHRKNFMRENVRQLREMQICWQNKEQENKTAKGSKFKGEMPRIPLVNKAQPKQKGTYSVKGRTVQSAPTKPASQISKDPSLKAAKHTLSENRQRNRSEEKLVLRSATGDRTTLMGEEAATTSDRNTTSHSTCRESQCSALSDFNSRGSQTLDPSNLDSLDSEGVIKYPSSRKSPERVKTHLKSVPTRDMALQTEDSVDSKRCKRRACSSKSSSTDVTITEIKPIDMAVMRDSASEEEENLEPEDMKTNGRNVMYMTSAGSTYVDTDNLRAPPNYRKGVVPKYLRERQEEWRQAAQQQESETVDPACPPGHVLLPDLDRKDTLKMLRKSYSDLVQELNMMPVRSDTLKVRHRKMELEQQLNKLEEGIKVFSRPKVYVKVTV